MSTARIVFAGTPEFAQESLRALVLSGNAPVAVLTQPDRPAGRGKRLSASAVKQYALEQGIEVLQPVTLRDDRVQQQLLDLHADLMVVAAYGLLLPQAVLDIPRLGCVNVHASLLPRWRGAAPVQAAILAGDTHTGISLMAMTAGLDCGPVYAQQELEIAADETAGELQRRLAKAGSALLTEQLAALLAGKLDAREQNEEQASYAPKIASADAQLDWQQAAQTLQRQVRAYNPVPGAWFMLGAERIKCWRARCRGASQAPAGTVVAAGTDGIVIACGVDSLCLQTLQRPGKRPVSAAEFSSGQRLLGQRL